MRPTHVVIKENKDLTASRADYLYLLHVSGKLVDVAADLCQQDNSLPIRPDDVVHLRSDSFPRQLRCSKARLEELRRISLVLTQWLEIC